jgi:hypothetical protein
MAAAIGLCRRGKTDDRIYGPEFDPATGNGGFEIWMPVQAK